MKKNSTLYNHKLDYLQEKINKIKENQLQKNQQNNNSFSNIKLMYSISVDLFSGIITAFILNKIYTFFFQKNTAVFFLLLITCSIAGLYNTIKFIKREKI